MSQEHQLDCLRYLLKHLKQIFHFTDWMFPLQTFNRGTRRLSLVHDLPCLGRLGLFPQGTSSLVVSLYKFNLVQCVLTSLTRQSGRIVAGTAVHSTTIYFVSARSQICGARLRPHPIIYAWYVRRVVSVVFPAVTYVPATSGVRSDQLKSRQQRWSPPARKLVDVCCLPVAACNCSSARRCYLAGGRSVTF